MGQVLAERRELAVIVAAVIDVGAQGIALGHHAFEFAAQRRIARDLLFQRGRESLALGAVGRRLLQQAVPLGGDGALLERDLLAEGGDLRLAVETLAPDAVDHPPEFRSGFRQRRRPVESAARSPEHQARERRNAFV
jgi:hypothetical protein